MAKSNHPNKPHAILFPYPYQGHITPMINLAINLASKGFKITYIHPEFIHHAMSKHDPTRSAGIDPFAGARESGLDIRYATISDGFPLEFDRDANFSEYWESMIREFPDRVDELVRKLGFLGGDNFLLIADSLYSWPATIARKHKVVSVTLWTEPAMVFSIGYHLDLLRQNGHFPYGGNGVDRINYIPGVESISTKDLMSYIQHPEIVPVLTKIVINAFEQVKNTDFILCNTVQELESEPLSALNQNQPIYAIGPINFYTDFTKPIVEKSLWLESDCTQWLNSKPHGSVLYISFGSIAHISKQEIKELAHGLVLSEVNFIWVLRTNFGDSNVNNDVLPVGFENDVKDRGLVVPWCNQNMVLCSPAVGGFLTHCGWNSVLESMWSGVPMICYPFFVDQPTNRKLVVDDWKIGINLCDNGSQLVTREEVVSKINAFMRGEICDDLREEMKKVSKTLRNALDVGGSSRTNFDRFVHDLKARLCVTREDGLKN